MTCVTITPPPLTAEPFSGNYIDNDDTEEGNDDDDDDDSDSDNDFD